MMRHTRTTALLLVGMALSACAAFGAHTGEDGQTAEFGANDDCTLTQGYWKNHAKNWPVSTLTIGGVTYTEAELLTLLWTPTGGDASLILGHQLIAALLNQASGATVPPDVAQALADADAWMAANKDADGKLPYGTPTSGAAHDQAVALSATLDAYNQGQIGPGHCGDNEGSGGSTQTGSSTTSGSGGSGGFEIPTGSSTTSGSGGSTTTTGGGGTSTGCTQPCGVDLPPCASSDLCLDGCCQPVPL